MAKENQHTTWKLRLSRLLRLPSAFIVVGIGCVTAKTASGPEAPATPTVAPVAPATPTVIHDLPEDAEGILNESDKIGARIQDPNPINRADYLTELCRVSVQVKSAKVATRCRAAFDFARKNVAGCESEKLQAQAVASLSAVDAQLAMDLLGEIPNPCGRGGQN